MRLKRIEIQKYKSIKEPIEINFYDDLLMRMGDNMAMDMDSGELHIISGWSDDEDND